MAKTRPGDTDIKRLFTFAGNRCAFPKCTTPVFLENTLVAEVCHIRGEKPTSARYDSLQSPEERHSYENLIVMCAIHHTVIDNDEESYTVERLLKLKADHERGATPLSDAQATQITQLYIETVNLHSDSNQAKHARELQAVEKIWNIMVNLRNEFSLAILADTIFIPDEMNRYFSGQDQHPMFETIAPYRDQMLIGDKIKNAGTTDAPREQPFIDQRLYALYSALIVLLGRAAMLLCLSFKDRKYHNWRDDDVTQRQLSSVLPARTIDALKARGTYCLQAVIGEIERSFNEIARR